MKNQFQPMLASSENVTLDMLPQIKLPKWVTTKEDGIRCQMREGAAYSRSGKLIPNMWVQEWTRSEGRRLHGLDGELIVPGATFHETQSKIMTEYSLPFVFHFLVFDDFSMPKLGYLQRLQIAESKVIAVRSGLLTTNVRISVLNPVRCTAPHLIRKLYNQVMVARGEGLILRDGDAPYKFGRATFKSEWMLKMKEFEDQEALIIGFIPEQQNNNPKTRDAFGYAKRSSHKANQSTKEQLGAFICKDCKTGVVFNVGSGMTVDQRIEFWQDRARLMGEFLTYKSQTHGRKDAPRTPIFKGIRQD